MITYYLKIALRQINKNKTQYILSIIGIAVGLLCFSMTNYYIRRAFNQFTVWPNADRIAKVNIKPNTNNSYNAYFTGKELQMLLTDPIAGIEKITWVENEDKKNITFIKEDGTEIPFICNTYNITDDFISIYSLKSIAGDISSLNPGEVIISQRMAEKVFGKENPLGKIIYPTPSHIDTSPIQYSTIRAVIKNLPDNVSENKDLYFPITKPIDPNYNYWSSVTILLEKGISTEEINKRLKAQIQPFGEKNEQYLGVEILRSLALKSPLFATALIMGIIGSLVLVVALINFLKLCIQSFYSRNRELSLRKSLGSTQWDLFYLLFSEVFILLIISVFVTFVLTELFLPYFFLYFLPLTLSKDPAIQVNTSLLFQQQIEYLMGLFLLCGAISYFSVTRIKYTNLIRGIRGGNNGKHRIRDIMLGIQIFICFLFISAGVGLNIVFNYLQDFNDETLTSEECQQIWQIKLDEPQLSGLESEIINEISALAGVEEIMHQAKEPEVQYKISDDITIIGGSLITSSNYANFMHMPMEGRMPQSSQEIAVSRSFIWEQEDRGITTRMVQLDDKIYHITGIYEQIPFHLKLTREQFKKIDSPIRFTVLKHADDDMYKHNFYIKSRPNQQETVKEGIFQIVRTHLPESIPFEIISMDEGNKLSGGGGTGGIIGDIFLLLSIISLIITVIGIHSAITSDTQNRRKEVAIRKINGAGHEAIALLFGKLYIRLLFITVIPAFVIVYLSLYKFMNAEIPIYSGWLNNPVIWLSIFLFVCIIILTTVAYRIWHICRLNPAEVIKSE